MSTFNVIIAGVGGQGSLLASRIIGNVLLSRHADVKVSEVHGMSQRGGSVVTYVRAGDEVQSPIVPRGECDLLIALEKLEALRWVSHLRAGGIVAASDQRIDPMPVIIGAARYPDDAEAALGASGARCVIVPAARLAAGVGIARASNVVVIGAASALSDIPEETWLDALKACVKPEFIDKNIEAFRLGRAIR